MEVEASIPKEDEESDDDTVLDVTEEVLKARRQKQLEEITDLCSDTESDISSDSDDEKDVDDDEDVFWDDESEGNDDDSASSNVNGNTYVPEIETREDKKPRAKRQKKEKLPPLQVLMNAKDIPAAPGKQNKSEEKAELEEESTLVDGAGRSKADQAVKDRVIKLLNTGFHKGSNENEAKNAMKIAQRLMRKHNLSQALLLKEQQEKEDNSSKGEILKGGIVTVKIVNTKTGKPAIMVRWIVDLMGPVSNNFDVKCYMCVARGRRCSVSFYGIYTNCQLAGYAFKVATERISQMSADYKPEKLVLSRRNISTRTSRLSYAIGIVRGISKDVDRNIAMEKQRQQESLEKKRQAASRGEAYEESDDEDGPGFSMPEPVKVTAAFNPKVSDLLDQNSHIHTLFDHEDDPSLEPVERVKRDLAKKIISGPPDRQRNDTLEMVFEQKARWKEKLSEKEFQTVWSEAKEYAFEVLEASQRKEFPKTKSDLEAARRKRRLREIEQERQAAIVLADHNEKIAEDVLKENDLKIRTGRKRKRINIDRRSLERGIEDSKEVDINQRAIRDEIKLKTEAKRPRK